MLILLQGGQLLFARGGRVLICGPYRAQVTSHSRGSDTSRGVRKGTTLHPSRRGLFAVHSPFPSWLRVQWDLGLGCLPCGTYLLEGSLGCLLAGGDKKMGETVRRGGHERKSREPHPQDQEPHRGPAALAIPPYSFLPSCGTDAPDLGELERRLHAGSDGAHFCNSRACKAKTRP